MLNPTYGRKYFDNFLYKVQPYSTRDVSRFQEIYRHKKEGSILEIGCGEGYLLKILEQKFDVRGIEISPYAAGIARKMLSEELIEVADVDSVDLGLERYDAVVAYNILEHLKQPENTLEKISTSLKPGGVLIGSVPNHQSFVGTTATAVSNILDVTHLSTLKVAKWRRLFASFNLTRIAEYGELPLGRNKSIFVKHKLWSHFTFNYILFTENKLFGCSSLNSRNICRDDFVWKIICFKPFTCTSFQFPLDTVQNRNLFSSGDINKNLTNRLWNGR